MERGRLLVMRERGEHQGSGVEDRSWLAARRCRLWLGLILVLAVCTRLYHLREPLVDQMFPKQIHNANKARNIARPPWNPLRNELDFLAADGQRAHLMEEVPVYTALVGASYRLLGEHELIGRVWSILATLAAITALFDLVRQEYDDEHGLVAALMFSISPLLIFYGRAVFPDPAMLACMLISATCFRRSVGESGDGSGRTGWVLAATAAGMMAGVFKYFGLLVLIPLADIAWRFGRWRAWLRPSFVLMALGIAAPTLAWVFGILLRVENPIARTVYTVLGDPWALLERRVYECLTVRFLIKDCGPVATFLIVAGVWAALRGRVVSRPAHAWTFMGLSFLLAFAPKLKDHDYYELLLLPAASTWAALGWAAVGARLRERRVRFTTRRGVLAALIALAVLVQSPLVMRDKFKTEVGFLTVARRLNQLCSGTSKYVLLGNEAPWPIVHYSQRPGWVLQETGLPAQWASVLDRMRALGADYVVLYFDPTTQPEERSTFDPLLAALPEVEHRVGPWCRGGKTCEYYIFDLRGSEVALKTAGTPAGNGTIRR
jgi:hypothetical protein